MDDVDLIEFVLWAWASLVMLVVSTMAMRWATHVADRAYHRLFVIDVARPAHYDDDDEYDDEEEDDDEEQEREERAVPADVEEIFMELEDE